jgi:tetratricopeptide (TPR) repeat protein
MDTETNQANESPEGELNATEIALLRAAMHKKMRAQLEQTYHNTYKNAQEPVSMPVFSLKKLISIAATFLLMFSAGWWGYNQWRTPLVQQTANLYLEKDVADSQNTTRRSPTQHKEDEQVIAKDAYREKNFDKAIVHYKHIINLNIATADDYFEVGLCHLFLNEPNYTAAITYFEAAKKLDATAALEDDRLWFTALAHIKLRNWKEASNVLAALSQSKSSRRITETKQLLELVNGMSSK